MWGTLSLVLWLMLRKSAAYCVVSAKLLQLCLTLCDPIDCSPPGFSVHGILHGQEYWSGLPYPPPGDLANLGIEPASNLN